MNFSDDKYRNIVNSDIKLNKVDALFLLIKDVAKHDLDNFIMHISEMLQKLNINMSDDEIYNVLQNPSLVDSNIQMEIVNIAYKIANSKESFGNNFVNGTINTSDWISHSINVSLFCENMARMINLDSDKAATLGLLHDYGRKFDHTFGHVIKGYETLYDMGYIREAEGCLTHSFINGGICANNEPAIDGFNIDKDGNVYFDNKLIRDDLFNFLEKYKYDEYDLLLNLGDLMATSNGITSSYDRVADIATRRKIDPKNRTYFYTELYNLLIKFVKELGYSADERVIKPIPELTEEKANNLFYLASLLFETVYTKSLDEYNRKARNV